MIYHQTDIFHYVFYVTVSLLALNESLRTPESPLVKKTVNIDGERLSPELGNIDWLASWLQQREESGYTHDQIFFTTNLITLVLKLNSLHIN